jgi:hypothetical protein
MATDKKNQHYIPKFYLRNFSYQNNKKQIGVFNIQSQFYYSQANLKHQGSKNFFYGTDGVIEDNLSVIEGDLARIIKVVLETNQLPKKESEEHIELLFFVALTDLRNPVRIEGAKLMFQEMASRIREMDENADTERFVPSMTHEEVIAMSFSGLKDVVRTISDLDYKLLFNKTSKPFISSDFPIVKYNQYLEAKKWPQSKTGYGLTGLQIFIPLSSDVAILFFDSDIYKVGDKKQKSYSITKEEDIDSLNILQFINCFETIFFDEKADEIYIRHLFKKSKRFKRANVSRAGLSYLFKDGDNQEEIVKSGKKNLIIMNSTDCETNLKIDGVKIHSRGAAHKLHPSAAQLRRKVQG